ncbi:MAG: carboxypeptidase-like regulatory domain-containing protein [Bacteroidota bacterium]
MRIAVILMLSFTMVSVLAQRSNSELISLTAVDQALESILDSVSQQTGFSFSYSASLFPEGSRYTIFAEEEPLDRFLSRLLVGTGLTYSLYRDQVIISYRTPQQLANGQQKYFQLSGKVLDENGDGLKYVNVFLNGTSIGSYTDIDGNYAIESIPSGFYDLVFSHVGYEKATIPISELSSSSRIQNYQMSLAQMVLADVVVNPRRIEKGSLAWLAYYQIFKKELLGSTANAAQSKIENPEAISFTYNQESNLLKVYAKEPINIRNDALGYRLEYFMESFSKDETDLRFRGEMRFKSQDPQSRKEKRIWRKNRKRSYQGSLNHFKKSLLKKELTKEGFKIFETATLKHQAAKHMKRLSEEDILIASKNGAYELQFDQNLLVLFRKEKESKAFLLTSDFAVRYYQDSSAKRNILLKKAGPQVSVIKRLQKSIRIDRAGQMMDKFAMSIDGYWSWERLADLVPLNYHPKMDKF